MHYILGKMVRNRALMQKMKEQVEEAMNVSVEIKKKDLVSDANDFKPEAIEAYLKSSTFLKHYKIRDDVILAKMYI